MSTNFVGGGDIDRSRFVKLHTTVGQVVQAGAGEFAIGISGESAQDAPITGASDLAVSAGRSLKVYQDGDECQITAGGTFSVGAYLKSDSTGRGVTASSTQPFHAIALEAATAAVQKVRCLVKYGVAP